MTTALPRNAQKYREEEARLRKAGSPIDDRIKLEGNLECALKMPKLTARHPERMRRGGQIRSPREKSLIFCLFFLSFSSGFLPCFFRLENHLSLLFVEALHKTTKIANKRFYRSRKLHISFRGSKKKIILRRMRTNRQTNYL